MRTLLIVWGTVVFLMMGQGLAQSLLSHDDWTRGVADPADQDTHEFVLTPDQEQEFWREVGDESHFIQIRFRFPQTDWYECTDQVTGNFRGYNCVRRRQVSSILKDFMDDHMVRCVDESLQSHNMGELDELHLIHLGVLGDPRHSPRSLHAENRAIDIHTMRVVFTNGERRDFVFGNAQKRSFFTSFRQCWGRALVEHNDCPYYSGQALLTGSIGWEDRNHQSHMHTSVPYCINGRYAGNYFRR